MWMSAVLAPFARRIVVRVGRFLGRSQLFGDVAQVHADAGPERGTATHSVDENIVDGKMSGGFRIFLLPALQACQCVGFTQ